MGAADAFSEESTYFVVERALGDGSLPDPGPQAEANGWIGEYQWDMLIYMWSNAEIRSTSESFSGLNAAKKYCGINRGLGHKDPEKKRRNARLFNGLESAGLLRYSRSSEQGLRTYWELRLAPTWTPAGVVASREPRTWTNLSRPGRTWFKMPFVLITNGPKPGAWATLSHRERRVLVALYVFYDETTFGGVDPNHLCLRGTNLCVSPEFSRACGHAATIEEVAEALGELWRRHLLGFLSAQFDEDAAFPAAPIGSVRWATRCDPDSVDTALVGLRHVPRSDEAITV